MSKFQLAQVTSCSGCAADKKQAFNFYSTNGAGNFHCAEHDIAWFNPDEQKVAQLPWRDGHICIPDRTENWQQYLIP